MKRILIGLAAAALSLNVSAAWMTQDIPVTQGEIKSTVHAAYTTANIKAEYQAAISAQCFTGKPMIVMMELAENLSVDSITSKILVDGRVFRENFNWTVAGNKLMFIPKMNPDAIKAMKRGKVMRIMIDEKGLKMDISFDLQQFTTSFNTVRQHCEK